MNVEKLKQLKKDAGYTNQMISDESGVPLGTVQKIFSGETKAPRFKTLKAIEGILVGASGYENDLKLAALQNQNSFQEKSAEKSASVLKKSFEQQKAKAGDQNDSGASVVKNMLFEMMAGEIVFIIKKYLEENNIEGYVFGNHVSIKLSDDGSQYETINPHVVFIKNRDMIKKDCIIGAPNMVIEIMDSETKNMQIGVRPDKYRDAGIQEYWMIDATSKNIVVYDFEREAFPSMYGFSGRVPVKSLESNCEVNFAKLYSQVGFLFSDVL